MKKYLILIILLLSFFAISCGDDEKYVYVPPVPDEVENFQKVEAIHEVKYEDISSYVLIKTHPQGNDLLYSITLYMDFQKGERTNRLYNYYQVDYLLEDNTFGFDYHLFDSIDGIERVYAQNFMPFYNLNSQIKNIKVLVKYSFDQKNEDNENIHYDKKMSYSEDILEIGNKEEYLNIISDFNINLIDNSVTSEDYNRYKLQINSEIREGHIDVQTWMELKDGSLYPLYGIYNYDLSRGNYLSVSDDKLDRKYEIAKMYYKINYYDLDGKLTTYLLIR